jgi:hypothetical protein
LIGPQGLPGMQGPPGPPAPLPVVGDACGPPGFTMQIVAVHQRQPTDTDRMIFVCALG